MHRYARERDTWWHRQPRRPGRLMSLHDEEWKRRKATPGKRKKRNSTLCRIDAFLPRFYRYFFSPIIRDCFLRKTAKKAWERKPLNCPCFVCRALFPVRVRVAAALRSSETNLWEFGSLANEAGDTDAATSSKLFFPSISSSSSSSSSSSPFFFFFFFLLAP